MWRSTYGCMEQAPTHVGTICALVRQAACCGICTNSSRTEDENAHPLQTQFNLQLFGSLKLAMVETVMQQREAHHVQG